MRLLNPETLNILEIVPRRGGPKPKEKQLLETEACYNMHGTPGGSSLLALPALRQLDPLGTVCGRARLSDDSEAEATNARLCLEVLKKLARPLPETLYDLGLNGYTLNPEDCSLSVVFRRITLTPKP